MEQLQDAEFEEVENDNNELLTKVQCLRALLAESTAREDHPKETVDN